MEPWVAVGSSIFKKTTLFNNPPICTVYSGPDNEANTRLIAAAPETAEQRDELLATLEWIIGDSWNDGIGSWAHVQRRVEEAIAKAKGGN